MTGRELIRWCGPPQRCHSFTREGVTKMLLWLAPTDSATALGVGLNTRRWANRMHHRDWTAQIASWDFLG
jgi:hypothetical protein